MQREEMELLAVRATLWRMEIEILREIHRYRFAKRGRRFGSKADIGAPPINVRFTPKSRHWNSAAKFPLCAISRHKQCSKQRPIRSPRLCQRRNDGRD